MKAHFPVSPAPCSSYSITKYTEKQQTPKLFHPQCFDSLSVSGCVYVLKREYWGWIHAGTNFLWVTFRWDEASSESLGLFYVCCTLRSLCSSSWCPHPEGGEGGDGGLGGAKSGSTDTWGNFWNPLGIFWGAFSKLQSLRRDSERPPKLLVLMLDAFIFCIRAFCTWTRLLERGWVCKKFNSGASQSVVMWTLFTALTHEPSPPYC